MTRALKSLPFPAPEHDHGPCLEDALERARRAFEAKGLKLTPLRQSVFEEIAGSHRAVGAYEVLEKLASRGDRLAPISVYRAIDALVEVGLVHRFESRNAFFACHRGHEGRQLVLACEACGRVAEVGAPAVFSGIDKAAADASFSLRTSVVEVWGLCASCKAAGKDPVTTSSAARERA
ncbi:MAG: Fur family transcriptional regulator [Hyphomicrobiaceae bacterium]|nr:Fur family transcriptional regulator [Hyphomicrobiaceae bacterium]